MIALLKHWKLGLGVIGVLVILYAGYQIYKRGYNDCNTETVKKISEGIINEKNTHKKLEADVMLSNDTDLDKRLNRWLRD